MEHPEELNFRRKVAIFFTAEKLNSAPKPKPGTVEDGGNGGMATEIETNP